MKKMKTIFAIACATLMITSCSKTYTCTCIYTSGSSSTTTTSSITSSKKSLAKTSCESQNVSAGGSAKTCSITN